MCVAPSRAQAEDIAATVSLDIEELPAVYDMLAAREPGSALLHEHWGDNVFLETFVDLNFEKAASAPIKVTREIRTARQCMAPIEGRGVVAIWDRRLEHLTIYSACQMPHIVRTGLAGCLGLDEGQVRVIAPDVGGGFGYKGILLAEEVCLGWLAMRCGHPVRWIEDRREHLTAGANCREHHYRITGYADRDGRLVGIDCEATVDSGAYSAYPFSACLEAAQVASILPGPYDFPAYRCRTYSAATNKCPILPYRGVARTGVCFAIELVLDAIAREAGVEPHEVRAKSWCPRQNAIHQHHQEVVRQRRLSGIAAPRRRCHQYSGGARTAEARRTRRPPDRRRACDLLRAGCARHLRLLRLGHPDGAGLRAGDRAAYSRRGTRTARRHSVAWAGIGDDACSGRSRDPRHRHSQDQGRARRHRDDPLLDRDLGVALHGDGGRRSFHGLQGDRQARSQNRRAAPANRRQPSHGAGRRNCGPAQFDLARRDRTRLVPAAAEPAERRRYGRSRSDHRLPPVARQRHF